MHQLAKVLELQDQSLKRIFRTISFRNDWFDLLAVQGTLKSLLQHHISKASVLWRSAFFMVQLSHPYMITGQTIRGCEIRALSPYMIRSLMSGSQVLEKDIPGLSNLSRGWSKICISKGKGKNLQLQVL